MCIAITYEKSFHKIKLCLTDKTITDYELATHYALTIYDDNWFFDRSLVMILRFQQGKAKEVAYISTLIPSHMEMVYINSS